jgi:hypothetical protein
MSPEDRRRRFKSPSRSGQWGVEQHEGMYLAVFETRLILAFFSLILEDAALNGG